MTVLIKDKIVSWEVSSKAEATTKAQDKSVPAPVVKDRLIDRPGVLEGKTYKIKPGNSDHAFYVTITNMNGRPYEMFIATKGAEHYQWIIALTRTVSAIMRNVPDSRFIVEELMQVQDPAGGFWMNQRYVPSIVAAIGNVLSNHYDSLESEKIDEQKSANTLAEVDKMIPNQKTNKQQCPKCLDYSVVMEEGCLKCQSCGWSKCS